MIQTADESMLPRLKRLWQTCFEDTPQGTQLVFDHLLTPHQMLVWTEEGRPVAMLNWKLLRFSTPRAAFPGAYVFGVATLPQHRGKGISRALMDALHPLLAAQGAALACLVPAGESLFDFYGRQGYQKAFSYKLLEVAPGEIGPAGGDLRPCPMEELAELRNRAFSRSSLFGAWDADYLRFVDRECRFYGGEVLRFSQGEAAGYAVCYPREEGVLVKEAAVEPPHLGALLSALHRRYKAAAYRLRLPADFPGGGETLLPFAMVKWYDRKKAEQAAGSLGSAPWFAFGLDE